MNIIKMGSRKVASLNKKAIRKNSFLEKAADDAFAAWQREWVRGLGEEGGDRVLRDELHRAYKELDALRHSARRKKGFISCNERLAAAVLGPK